MPRPLEKTILLLIILLPYFLGESTKIPLEVRLFTRMPLDTKPETRNPKPETLNPDFKMFYNPWGLASLLGHPALRVCE